MLRERKYGNKRKYERGSTPLRSAPGLRLWENSLGAIIVVNMLGKCERKELYGCI